MSFRTLLLLFVGLIQASLVSAANKNPDLDLLEFLGSLDNEGDDFGDYLANSELDKVTPPAVTSPPVAGTPVMNRPQPPALKSPPATTKPPQSSASPPGARP